MKKPQEKTFGRIVITNQHGFNARGLHFNRKLCGLKNTVGETFFPPLRDNSTFRNLSGDIQEMAKSLLALDAVTRVGINHTYVEVTIGVAFEWKDVEEQFIDIVAQCVFPDEPYEVSRLNEQCEETKQITRMQRFIAGVRSMLCRTSLTA